jgi:methylthioribose-1-phosphate isomerase
LAKYHGVKFLVAAPRTSIDLTKHSGDEIEIEHRPQNELTFVRGPVISISGDTLTDQVASVSTAPLGMKVWNPSFDVTPAELIDGIITESGVVVKEPGSKEFAMQKFFDR